MLATPAAPAGRLLSGLAAESAERFAAIPYASMAVVALALRGVEPVGSGLLVPPGELPTVKAVTYSSAKWGWLARAGHRRLGRRRARGAGQCRRLGEERCCRSTTPR